MILHPIFEILLRKPTGKVYEIVAVKEVRIQSSRTLRADRLELTLPKLQDLRLFEENDELLVSLGYQELGMERVFWGLITYVSPADRPVVQAEDFFKTLKEVRGVALYQGENPQDVVADLLSQTDLALEAPFAYDQQVSLVWSNETVAEALDFVAKQVGADAFIVPARKALYFGPPYGLETHRIWRFGFQRNILDHHLEYRTGSVQRVVVYVADPKLRGPSLRVEVGQGEPSREFTLFHSFNPAEPESQQRAAEAGQRFAEQKLKELQQSGFRGSLTTFGNPFLKHSQKIYLEDAEHPERSGHYFVDAVEYTFSVDQGFRMKVTVGGEPHVFPA